MEAEDELPEDAVLLDRARAGDAESFGVLFDRHHQRVFRHALRLIPASASAEELVAMVFLEAWRKRGSLTVADGTILPWLLVTANNLARNVRRAERRYERFLARLPEPESELDLAQGVADRLETDERSRTLSRAFDELSQRDRDILTLCVLEELPLSAAGSALGIPLGTVKSRLSRAKARLAGLVPHLALIAEPSIHRSL